MTDQPNDQASTTKPEPRVITLQEFSDNTEAVIEHMNAEGRPVVITHYGRFVALIRPITDDQVIGEALRNGPIANELNARVAKLDNNDTNQ